MLAAQHRALFICTAIQFSGSTPDPRTMFISIPSGPPSLLVRPRAVPIPLASNERNRVDTRNQGVRFPRAPSGRIDPWSVSLGIQVSLVGAMGD